MANMYSDLRCRLKHVMDNYNNGWHRALPQVWHPRELRVRLPLGLVLVAHVFILLEPLCSLQWM